MTSTELNDLRRSLERMQSALETLSDRYRDLRRERRQLRERIDELVSERESSTAASAAEVERAAGDRRRAAELEERALRAEKKHEELYNRISSLEAAVAERERMLAEQEDMISRLSLSRTEDAARAQGADVERIREMEEEIGALRASLVRLREERTELESKQDQTIAKLDSATRAEAAARIEQARLERERDALATTIEAREKAISELRSERDAALANVETLTLRLKGLESSDDERLKAQRARIESLSNDLSDALDMAARHERDLNEARAEVEQLRRREHELVAEITAATAGGLGIDPEERQAMARQIDAVIELIDRHLGEN